jgi:hypothetical protein
MKRQMVKGLTMLTLIMALALATAVVTANAQSSVRVKAQIPFEFTVGNETLPAGEYMVRPATNNGEVLSVENAKTSVSSIRIATPIKPNGESNARLVFHRYGELYFLREVWGGGESIGRELLESKHERTVKNEASKIARNNYEIVEIVATLQ